MTQANAYRSNLHGIAGKKQCRIHRTGKRLRARAWRVFPRLMPHFLWSRPMRLVPLKGVKAMRLRNTWPSGAGTSEPFCVWRMMRNDMGRQGMRLSAEWSFVRLRKTISSTVHASQSGVHFMLRVRGAAGQGVRRRSLPQGSLGALGEDIAGRGRCAASTPVVVVSFPYEPVVRWVCRRVEHQLVLSRVEVRRVELQRAHRAHHEDLLLVRATRADARDLSSQRGSQRTTGSEQGGGGGVARRRASRLVDLVPGRVRRSAVYVRAKVPQAVDAEGEVDGHLRCEVACV